jgi:hypothetical protein
VAAHDAAAKLIFAVMRGPAVLRGVVACWLGASGCASKPEINGGALVVNMQPPAPQLVGAYDFDLLDAVQGRSCVTRSSDGTEPSIYWFRGAGLDKLAPDPLTAHAIGAAAFDAMKRAPTADSLVITRVVAEGHGPDKVCAFVFGRGVRLTKAGSRRESNEHDDDLQPPHSW